MARSIRRGTVDCGQIGAPLALAGVMPGGSRWPEQRNREWVQFRRWRDDRLAEDCSARELPQEEKPL